MLEIVGDRLEAGVVVAGAYRLERVVGEGGMGVVWAARELSSDRTVALKFLREGGESDPKLRERFVREARAAMTVDHPNVAKVDSVLETDVGVPFFVMELLEGESLRGLLTRRRTLPADEAARLVSTVVDAVGAAHAARIVHRDLKPENVFLVRGTDVRVLDFGIAKHLPASRAEEPTGTALTTAGSLIGTPLYMAPEQIFGEEVDPSADVWALGIILYECIAGRRPTDAEGFGQVIKRITVDPIEPLERAAPSCPPVLARLVARMLMRDRASRPPLTEVKATLDHVAAAPDSASTEPAPRTHRIGPDPTVATPIHPGPAPAPPPPKGFFKENAVILAVSGAIAIVIFIVVITAATAVAVINKDKFESPAPAPSASASAPSASPKQRSEEASAALDAARAAQESRDGTTCLAKLDRHDEVSLVFKSRDVGGMYSDLRAKCLMLAKRCTEGRALLRTYLEKKPSLGRPFEDELEQVVSEQCEGDDLSPREDLLRAAFRLRSLPSPTTAQCNAWAATLDTLLPKVPSRGALDEAHARVTRERTSLRAQCHSRVKLN